MLNRAPRTRLEVGRVRPLGTRSRRPCAPPAMILSAMIAGRVAHSRSHEPGQPARAAESFLLLHLCAAAAQRAGAALGDDHLGAARGADVDLPDLTGHRSVLLSSLVARRTALEKRSDAFPPIGRPLHPHVEIVLEPHALVQWQGGHAHPPPPSRAPGPAAARPQTPRPDAGRARACASAPPPATPHPHPA